MDAQLHMDVYAHVAVAFLLLFRYMINRGLRFEAKFSNSGCIPNSLISFHLCRASARSPLSMYFSVAEQICDT